MSAALMILPVVWAYAPTSALEHAAPGRLAEAAAQLEAYAAAPSSVAGGRTDLAGPRTDVAGQRKGPHALRLVQATAHATAQATAAAVAVPAADAASTRRAPEPGAHAPQPAPVAEVAFYRKYTEALLRRYVKLSLEAGRVPSLLGQEMFRGRVTSYKVRSFEDVVIFVHDVGKCLDLLEPAERALIRRIAMQGHTQGEAATLLGISLRTVVRRYADAVDALTRIFLERKLLELQV